MLDEWERSDRRTRVRELLLERDGIDPDEVILTPERASAMGMTSTVCFPLGNLAPQGSVVKSTAIAADLIDADGVYRHSGPARVFTSERAAIAAIKEGRIAKGDVLCVIGRGPLGSGMEETYQLTSALKYLDYGGHVPLLTDARFSGVSTGACIGHVGPEALAGGPIGKLRDGDLIAIEIDRVELEGTRRSRRLRRRALRRGARSRDPRRPLAAPRPRSRSGALRRHAPVGAPAVALGRHLGRLRLRRGRDRARGARSGRGRAGLTAGRACR